MYRKRQAEEDGRWYSTGEHTTKSTASAPSTFAPTSQSGTPISRFADVDGFSTTSEAGSSPARRRLADLDESPRSCQVGLPGGLQLSDLFHLPVSGGEDSEYGSSSPAQNMDVPGFVVCGRDGRAGSSDPPNTSACVEEPAAGQVEKFDRSRVFLSSTVDEETRRKKTAAAGGGKGSPGEEIIRGFYISSEYLHARCGS